MPSWRKRLAAMVADDDPRSYTYEETAGVLEHLGFTLANPKNTGTHRKFRLEVDDTEAPNGRRGITIGLVQKGHGTLHPDFVKEMVQILRSNNLLPPGV